MGNKIATEEDYWMCTGGIMPAQMQTTQNTIKQKDGKKYLMVSDTASSPYSDFTCRWIMLIAAAIAAIVVVAIVATGGAALAVIIAAGALAGAAGAAFGSVMGSMLCGQKAAIARIWLGDKSNLKIAGQNALTTGSIMTCPIFGSQITHAPNVKTWWDALRVGMGNFAETVIMGAMGGALVGAIGGAIAGAATLALLTWGSIGSNILGSVTGWGMATRAFFGANAVSNKQAMGKIDINIEEQRDAAFNNAAFPEWGSLKRIFTGHAQPMDAMLVLYFLHLKNPVSGSGTFGEESPTAVNEEPLKPTENKTPAEEQPAPKEDGKAYEGVEGKNNVILEGGTAGGPGKYVKGPKRTGKGIKYQHDKMGTDLEYQVNTEKMKSGKKLFDGYDPQTGELLDSKDWNNGYPPPGSRTTSAIKDAIKQVIIAREKGTIVRWEVPTESAKAHLENVFDIEAMDPYINDINIVVNPK
ncbi:hypothetical protein [Pedobacter nototheniae]|uniref:hypothetical protein n=1 Tax=Pedobacter nototheniae TaxID=2488994 RepID=UPI00103E71A1|nr:hypothetical protein [Pedobacter nototheniae]